MTTSSTTTNTTSPPVASKPSTSTDLTQTGTTTTSPNPLTTTSIPHIPLLSLLSPHNTNPSTRTTHLLTLRSALLDVGFLYLTDLQPLLPTSLTTRLTSIIPRLFHDCTPAQKQTAALLNTPHFLGYSAFGTETTAGGRDQREQLEVAGYRWADGGDEGRVRWGGGHADGGGGGDNGEKGRRPPLYERLRGPNQWPDFEGREELEEVVGEYIAAVQKVAEEFLGLVDEALGLVRGTLEGFASSSADEQERKPVQDRLKIVHYQTGADGERELGNHGHDDGEIDYVQGVGPHKDSSGWLTFLLQASPITRGLQALSKDGAWLDVPPLEGSLVVNMGQAFEAATNGVCKATTHRVLLPQGMGSRYSVPFFMGVRPSLTKDELKGLWEYFEPGKWKTRESEEGMRVDSPFLRGAYETWGEAQLRTKVRSHRDVGKRWYADVFDRYVNDG